MTLGSSMAASIFILQLHLGHWLMSILKARFRSLAQDIHLGQDLGSHHCLR